MGFRGEILTFLQNMYASPAERVHVNNHLSSKINLKKGMTGLFPVARIVQPSLGAVVEVLDSTPWVTWHNNR